jgi:hypothetical protein
VRASPEGENRLLRDGKLSVDPVLDLGDPGCPDDRRCRCVVSTDTAAYADQATAVQRSAAAPATTQ